MPRRFLLCLVLLVALPACAARGILSVVPERAPGAAIQPVFVATNRLPAAPAQAGLFRQSFGATRDPTLRYARIDVSVPPVHRTGQIEWPGGARPDPAQHFVVASEARFDRAGFLAALDAAAPPDRREVLVFVHGYNTNNAEATYRLAQIAHDFGAEVPVVAYSWPSAGNPRGYVYDRDSVVFSRDGLEQLLDALTLDQGRRVFLVAHSMGSQLVMETLRQMSIAGRRSALERLNGVALISPDIDADVFVQQARRIAPLPQPFMVMASRDDRVLDLSAFLTGKPTRLGSIRSPAPLQGLPITFVDLSGIPGGDRAGHSTAFTAPRAIELLRELRPR